MESKLPKLIELYEDQEMVVKKSELNVLLNQQPKNDWVLKHPIIKKEIVNEEGIKIKVPYEYIPIERMQWLMHRIFGGYTLEVLSYNILANSIAVHVRIRYKNVLTNEETFVDGLGAVAIQIKASNDKNNEVSAIDFGRMRSAAIQMSLPAAKSYAEKDAISSIGRLFGRDINRIDETLYQSVRNEYEKIEIDKLKVEISKLINSFTDEKVKDRYMELVTNIEFGDESESVEAYEELIKKIKLGNEKG